MWDGTYAHPPVERKQPVFQPFHQACDSVVTTAGELLGVNGEHSVQVTEDDVCQIPIAHHDQCRRIDSSEMSADSLKASWLFVCTTENRYSKRALKPIGGCTAWIIERTCRVAQHGLRQRRMVRPASVLPRVCTQASCTACAAPRSPWPKGSIR